MCSVLQATSSEKGRTYELEQLVTFYAQVAK